MRHDNYGRRLFRSEARAFQAQKTAMLNHGICTGVIKLNDREYVLFHDPLAELWT